MYVPVPEATFSPTIAGTVKLPEAAPPEAAEVEDGLADADAFAVADTLGAALAAGGDVEATGADVAGAAVGEPCDAAGEPAVGDPPRVDEAEAAAGLDALELHAARPPPAARTATITAEARRTFIVMVTLPLSN